MPSRLVTKNSRPNFSSIDLRKSRGIFRRLFSSIFAVKLPRNMLALPPRSTLDHSDGKGRVGGCQSLRNGRGCPARGDVGGSLLLRWPIQVQTSKTMAGGPGGGQSFRVCRERDSIRGLACYELH